MDTTEGRGPRPFCPPVPTVSPSTWSLAPVGLLAATAAFVACGPTPGRAVALAATGLATVAVVVGIVRHQPATARSWLLLAFGRCALAISAFEASSGSALGTVLAAAVGYLATGYGLLELARHLTRVWDRTRWIDSAAVTIAAGTAALAVSLATTEGTVLERWLLPLLPAAALSLVLLATRSLLAVRPRGRALTLLGASLVVQWVGEMIVRWPGSLAEPSPVPLVAAAVAGLLLAGAALDPSVARTPVRAIPWRRMGPVRFAVLVSTFLVPLLTLVALGLADVLDAGAVVVLSVGTATLAVLVLARVTGLVSYADALADERHRSRFEALADHAHDAVAIIGADDRIAWASPAVRAVVGVEASAVVGEPLSALVGPATSRDLAAPLHRLASMATGATMEISARTLDERGGERELEGTATNLLAEPAVEGIVLVLRDVTERVAMQRQLVEQAFVDPLTGLANRALFVDRVGHALARPRRHGDGLVAALFIDLDDFKGVNDSLGHHSGDDLLAAVGRRITEALGPSDTAARLGGDEFAVLLESTDRDGASAVADRILDLLAVPFEVGELVLGVSASVGVALAADASDTAAVLLRNADLAMYEAKREGKGRARLYRAELHERELRQFTFRSELRSALDSEQFHLLYQPIVDIDTEEVVGAEALLRWNHPERGPISPLEFIPVAESTRAIIPIGRWVLRTACLQLAAWTREIGPLTMDVNVSAVQLLDPGFVDDVAAIIQETGVDPSLLVLELTESILVHDADVAREVLECLRSLGLRLAIDDFGTGYSSLAYLQHFPIDIVKIDRAFVNQLGEGGRARSLARSIIAIADSLGIATIAEGIETREQAADLTALSCEHGQGFHYSRPVPPAEFAAGLVRAPVVG